jgi:hypothetical protein
MTDSPKKTRLVLMKSAAGSGPAEGPFSLLFDSDYADRFAARMKPFIVQVVEQPRTLPQYLDDPAEFLPSHLSRHDVVIAINLHDEILLQIPDLSAAAGGKAIVVPREDPDWNSPWLRQEMTKECRRLGLEIAFPKPFCSLEEEADQPAIKNMIRDLKIGRPRLRLTCEQGKITKIEVIRSAPCGDTHYVAKNLVGKAIDDKLDWWAAKYWGSYPCRGSMKFDVEFEDNMQHVAGHLLLDALHDALAESGQDTDEKGS